MQVEKQEANKELNYINKLLMLLLISCKYKCYTTLSTYTVSAQFKFIPGLILRHNEIFLDRLWVGYECFFSNSMTQIILVVFCKKLKS
jgi:hypothetical protein